MPTIIEPKSHKVEDQKRHLNISRKIPFEFSNI